MRVVPTLLFVAMIAGAWNHFSSRPVDHARGTLAPKAPVQIDRSGLPSFSLKGYQIMPAAEFSLEARVLSTEPYHVGREADLSPVETMVLLFRVISSRSISAENGFPAGRPTATSDTWRSFRDASDTTSWIRRNSPFRL